MTEALKNELKTATAFAHAFLKAANEELDGLASREQRADAATQLYTALERVEMAEELSHV